jgi:hypothetical protein
MAGANALPYFASTSVTKKIATPASGEISSEHFVLSGNREQLAKDHGGRQGPQHSHPCHRAIPEGPRKDSAGT